MSDKPSLTLPTSVDTALDKTVEGTENPFVTLSKIVSAEFGVVHIVSALEVSGGCVLNVSKLYRNINGIDTVAESLVYIPGGKISDDENGNKKLI